MIDWESEKSTILINPKMPSKQQEEVFFHLNKYVDRFPGHIWVATSGSTGEAKWVALSKDAILASAQAVNLHFSITNNDSWLNPLPSFHVGGLGIYARSFLSDAKLFSFTQKWNPHAFVESAVGCQATLSALVPTQVFDLVKNQLKAPQTMRAIVVGGGALSPILCQQAKSLGWKLFPSYGMTECCSQVATAEDECSERLIPLSHVTINIDQDSRICLKSPSLLSGYVVISNGDSNFIDPKTDGWFRSEDKGEWQGTALKVLGRSGHFYKIGGESVDLIRLQHTLEQVKLDLRITFDAEVIATPDERLGHVITLISTDKNCEQLLYEYNSRVMPFEKIRSTQLVETIPRTALHKVCYSDLTQAMENK